MWRWFTHRRQGVPSIVIGLLSLGVVLNLASHSKLRYDSLPGFSDDYFAEFSHAVTTLLDDEKIVELARRRTEMLKDRAEAEEHFKRFGKPRVPTNHHFVLKDNLGY